MGAVVFQASLSRRQHSVAGGAGLQSSGAQTEVARCDSGLVLSEVRRHKYRPSAFRGGLTFLQKLTSASMQSESGIVPDFEVGEEFQEEPKTYYELKSQPLKNRSVLEARTVISKLWRFWCLGDNWGAHFPSVVPGPCVCQSPPPLLTFSGAGPCEVAPRPSLLSCWHHYATLGWCLVNINFKY